MNMFKFFLTFFSLSIFFLNAITLKEKLQDAKKGDFAIYEFNKTIHSISIYGISKDKVILEEVSFPSNLVDKKNLKKILEEGNIYPTNHMIYEIDLKKNIIKKAYSYINSSFIDLKDDESIFLKLINLNIRNLNDNERKKIGPSPMEGEKDRRRLWIPQKIKNGKITNNFQVEVGRAFWPNDSSIFANKVLDLYYDKEIFFPYFIEIESAGISYFIKTIDSGSNLKSHIKNIPKKPPQFKSMKAYYDEIVFKIEQDNEINELILYALDISNFEKEFIEMLCSFEKNGDEIILKVKKDFLNNILKKDHKYKWIATSKNKKDIYIELNKIFIFK